jgi:hypothetical protein
MHRQWRDNLVVCIQCDDLQKLADQALAVRQYSRNIRVTYVMTECVSGGSTRPTTNKTCETCYNSWYQ